MKKFRVIVCSVLSLLLALSLSSCMSIPSLEALSEQLSSVASSVNASSGGVSQEELEAILADYVKNKDLNEKMNNIADGQERSGDEYNITVNSTASEDLAAASHALLSVVSIFCDFEVTYNTYSGFGFGYRQVTQTVSTAGSGVIYQLDKSTGDAYIITNYHVVYYASANEEICQDISVYLYGQEAEQYTIPATYVGGSMSYDIAVLKVTGSEVLKKSAALAATFTDSDHVTVLDTAIAIGNPEGSGISATVGHVNVESETLTMTGADNVTTVEFRVIRIDTAVNGGNSGGGLFNNKGELIGIVNAKSSDSSIDNIGFAIPSNIARNIADNILYYGDGYVHRCLLGITVATSALYTNYNTETGKVEKLETVCVDTVSDTSIVKGKLDEGDIIKSVTIGDVTYEVNHTYNVVDLMLRIRPGDTVTLNILHDGSAGAVTVDFTGVTPTQVA